MTLKEFYFASQNRPKRFKKRHSYIYVMRAKRPATAKHTPLPWHTHDVQVHTYHEIDGKVSHYVVALCQEHTAIDMPVAEANAQFIELACNSHYELVESCKDIEMVYAEYMQLEKDPLSDRCQMVQCIIRKARSALAKAGVKP